MDTFLPLESVLQKKPLLKKCSVFSIMKWSNMDHISFKIGCKMYEFDKDSEEVTRMLINSTGKRQRNWTISKRERETSCTAGKSR